jgi:hypothetical protein
VSAFPIVGTAATWHFRTAGALFAAVAAGELTAQAARGPGGAGPVGWLLLLATAAWVVGLVWRERVGILRAWMCFAWVAVGSLALMMLAARHGFLFGRIEFGIREIARVGLVPLSVPLLWWLVVGGSYLVVEGLWGEMRAGISAFTAVITLQLGLMLLPFVGLLRGYWRWPPPESAADRGAAGAGASGATFFAMPWSALAAWFAVALGLSLGLVILGENWSLPEARQRRQAWVPAAVLLTVSIICLSAEALGRFWFAAFFGAVNAVLFGTVLFWYLRERGIRRA